MEELGGGDGRTRGVGFGEGRGSLGRTWTREEAGESTVARLGVYAEEPESWAGPGRFFFQKNLDGW